jgi:hypothetical protein
MGMYNIYHNDNKDGIEIGPEPFKCLSLLLYSMDGTSIERNYDGKNRRKNKVE